MVNRFTGPLRVEATTAHRWELLEDMGYLTGGDVHWILAGFWTDLASIPRLLQWLLPVNGESRRPAVLHDYLYAFPTANMHRADADRLFNEAMKVDGVPTWERLLMYAGVRVGGWWSWRKYRKCSVA